MKKLNRFNSPLTPIPTGKKVVVIEEERKVAKKELDEWIENCLAEGKNKNKKSE